MTESNQRRIKWVFACTWCSAPISQRERGRPRKYCSNTCRQLAYQDRKTDRVHVWLEHRERELKYYRFRLYQLHEVVEPFVDGRSSLSPEYDALCQEVFNVTDAHACISLHGYPRPPRGKRPVAHGPRPEGLWIRPRIRPDAR